MTGEPPVNSISAYSSNLGNNVNRKLVIVFGVLFLMLVFRNALSRDYNNETKTYLTSVGRSDVIDNIIPKTTTELRLEKLSKDELLNSLTKNMTNLMNEMQEMKNEIEKLKNTSKTNS